MRNDKSTTLIKPDCYHTVACANLYYIIVVLITVAQKINHSPSISLMLVLRGYCQVLQFTYAVRPVSNNRYGDQIAVIAKHSVQITFVQIPVNHRLLFVSQEQQGQEVLFPRFYQTYPGVRKCHRPIQIMFCHKSKKQLSKKLFQCPIAS